MIKAFRALVLTVLAYLLQVCVMQQLKIGGVAANIAAVNIAIITVSLGKKHAFCVSCLTGILLEAMTSSVGGLFAVLYPVVSMLFAQLFADMSEEKRERRMLRVTDRRGFKGDRNPHLRIPLCAMCIVASLETVYFLYATLSGTELALARLILRALLTVVYTGALAVVLMVPARWYLGMYGRRVRRAMVEVNGSEQ